MQIKLRNKLHKVDNIAGAAIRFVANQPATTTLTATTNSQGFATVDQNALPAGAYTCTIAAAHTSSEPVGPSLVSTGPVPDRIYRPVTLSLVRTISGFGSVAADNPQWATVTTGPNLLTIDIQPVWIRSSANSARGQAISMIVVHHTACDTGPAVMTFLAEKGPHYMIDTDGQIVKWVLDARSAWHAGVARWEGHANINERSIGIEIVHTSGKYPEAQYAALIPLLTRIRTAFPSIGARQIVGHSDVGTDSGGKLGRKSGDPGPSFEWTRLESAGLGLLPQSGPPAPGLYGGIFEILNSGALRRGDNDKQHRFGGSAHPKFTGTPVHDVQADLASIGYSVGTPDGDFGERTHSAVTAFQEHFFAGGRGKDPDGRVDFVTAGWIRAVARGVAAAATPT